VRNVSLFTVTPEETDETLTSLCGGIPRPYLYGEEAASERLALQNICVERGRPPSSAERSRIRQSFRN
jgi:hypothetical protein